MLWLVALWPAICLPQPADADSAAGDSAPVAYLDQYLVDDSVPGYFESVDQRDQLYGRRSLDVELGYYSATDELLGDDLEQGLNLRWSRETLNWGTLDLETSLVDLDGSRERNSLAHSEGVITLRHSAMPISSSNLLDTTLGHQRYFSSSLLHGGYRFRLPTSMLQGLRTDLSSDRRGVRLVTGSVGRSAGIRMPTFEATGGKLTAVAFDSQLSEGLEFGTEIVSVRDDDDIRDHTSVLLGTRYRGADNASEHAVRVMGDDEGNIALWTDSRHSLRNAMTIRYGVFHFDPEIVWSDLPIVTDQQGLYLRGERHNSRLNLMAGYDFIAHGQGGESATPFAAHTLTFNGSMRLRRTVLVGLSTSASDRSYSGTVADDQGIMRINLFTSLTLDVGDLRIDVYSDSISSQVESSRLDRQGAAASLRWQMPERIRLTTELRVEDDTDQRGHKQRAEFSTLLRYDLLDNLTAGIQASVHNTTGDRNVHSGGISLSADVRWRFAPNWFGSLVLNRNTSEIQQGLEETISRDAGVSSFWLTIRHQSNAGQPFARLGRSVAGVQGNGTIAGQVFFDENKDGIRQPSEEVAIGATVILDGRYEARTDQSGFYRFTPVPTGDHEIIVLTEELPLPWGLEDESPRTLSLAFRANTTLNFALTVID
jgi:hypothetical protein